MSVADSPSFLECWASRWLLKLSIAQDWIDFQKSTWKCRTFGNWKNIAFGQGLFTLTEMATTT